MRLYQKLNLKQYCNELHYTLIAVILLFASFNSKLFIFFLIVYLIFLLLTKKDIKLIIILLCVFSILNIYQEYKKHKTLPQDIVVTVIDKEASYVIGYYKNYKVLLYTQDDIKCGDVISCNISVNDIEEKSYQEDFDLKKYYHSKGIYHTYNINSYTKLKTKTNINTIKYKLINYYEQVLNEECFVYVKALFLGQNDFNDELKNAYSLLGISHILAISGLHINMLYTALVFIFRRLFRIHHDTVPIIIIGIYVFIIGFPVSCIRALIYLLIKSYDSTKRLKFTKLDILSISFVVILFLMPYAFNQTGFQLTFLVSFLLCFSYDLIKTKSALLNSYLTYVLVMLITLPVITSFINYFSFTSILLSPILTIVASFVLVPLAFILAIPFLGGVVNVILAPMLNLFTTFTLNLSNHTIGFSLCSFNFYTSLIYYVIYFIILVCISAKRPYLKYVMLLFIYLLFINNITFIDPYNRITFIDGGQGDSTLITLKNHKGNILIDCYNSYEYLNKKGIRELDYLILTHSDSDHIKDLDLILENIEVDKVIIPKYDNGFMSYYNKATFVLAQTNDVFIIDNIKINIL
ncbi:MAG: ComEC/Rec2 family competence protein, partial [Acholeplasmatales bacterium]|nr:ComEC/Rec2 family competence protein [Acholeplasmatales bacterium]